MGRKAMERHGEESERLVGVSTSCWSSLLRRVARCESAAKLGCKKSTRFGGGNVKDHGNKPIKLDSLLKSSFGRYVTPASRSHFTISNHRLRWAVGGMRFTAPLPVENGKSGGVRPFVQGGTHTHTLNIQNDTQKTFRRSVLSSANSIPWPYWSLCWLAPWLRRMLQPRRQRRCAPMEAKNSVSPRWKSCALYMACTIICHLM